MNIVGRKNKEAHDGNVFRKKEQNRSFKIKKHIGIGERQVKRELIFHKSGKTVSGQENRGGAQKNPLTMGPNMGISTAKFITVCQIRTGVSLPLISDIIL